MKSVAQKVSQLEGLLGTKDISEWEEGFIQSLVDRGGTGLTEKQLAVMDRIYSKHFGG